MRAVVYHGPRDVRVEDRPEPAATSGSCVVAVSLAALCGTDASEYAKGPTLMRREVPTVIGHEFVGTVLEPDPAGEGPPRGSRVVSGAGVSCGACPRCREGRTNLCWAYATLGLSLDGGAAERVAVPVATLKPVPDTLPDELAVLAQPLAVGLHAVDRSGAGDGDLVVVLGAGAIGSFVLLGLAATAVGHLVVADVAAASLASARQLAPAATVVHVDDLERVVSSLSAGRGADVVFETSGAAGAFGRALSLVRRGGTVQAVGLPSGPQPVALTPWVLAEVDVRTSVAHVVDTDLPRALEILDAARPSLRHVDVPLEAAVDEGLVPLAEGRSGGKVVIHVR